MGPLDEVSSVGPNPLDQYEGYNPINSTTTPLVTSNSNINNNFQFDPNLEATDWKEDSDYLLSMEEGPGPGGLVDFDNALDFQSFENGNDYSIESLGFLPPFLPTDDYVLPDLSFDFLNGQVAVDSNSNNDFLNYSNLISNVATQDFDWSYPQNSDSSLLDVEGLEVIGRGPVYPPAPIFQLPIATNSNNSKKQQSSSTANSISSSSNQYAQPIASTSTLSTHSSSIYPPTIPSPLYASTSSSSTTNTTSYSLTSAIASVTSSLPTPSSSSTPSTSLVKTRSLSLLKQPSTLQFPSNLTSSARPSRSSLSAENPTSSHKNWQGLYSSSGFDLVGMLARVASRPNAQIDIGPVDTKSAFVVCDASAYDQPIIFASETFQELTGYAGSEILGQNCRFLQSPNGVIVPGSKREHMDGRASFHLKRHISAGKESQTSMINYCKGGKPFINLLTVIPITWDSDTDEIAYYVGFQVSLAPSAPSRFQRLP